VVNKYYAKRVCEEIDALRGVFKGELDVEIIAGSFLVQERWCIHENLISFLQITVLKYFRTDAVKP